MQQKNKLLYETYVWVIKWCYTLALQLVTIRRFCNIGEIYFAENKVVNVCRATDIFKRSWSYRRKWMVR